MPSLAIRGETSCLPSYGTLRDAVRARGKKLVRVISMPCGERQEFTSRGRQTKRWLHFPKLGIGSLDRGPHTTANPCLAPMRVRLGTQSCRQIPADVAFATTERDIYLCAGASHPTTPFFAFETSATANRPEMATDREDHDIGGALPLIQGGPGHPRV
jgi:hypothetical protein